MVVNGNKLNCERKVQSRRAEGEGEGGREEGGVESEGGGERNVQSRGRGG